LQEPKNSQNEKIVNPQTFNSIILDRFIGLVGREENGGN
jgi:hypothetical protein